MTWGSTGFPYARLAAIFREEFQKTGSLESSCLPVVKFVEDNPELLAPLGERGHGNQSHLYGARDACPFGE